LSDTSVDIQALDSSDSGVSTDADILIKGH